MALSWNFGNRVLVLPADLLSVNATPEQLRVLLWIASDATLAEKPIQLAKLADCNQTAVKSALRFWEQAGILSATDTDSAEPKPAVKAKKEKNEKETPPSEPVLQREDSLPTYSSGEVADVMERRESLRSLVNESQRLLGKVFTLHELNLLIGMVDYLGLSEDYILVLLAHCKRLEINTLHRIERYAVGLVNAGITTTEALEEKLHRLESVAKLEGAVRAMFGLQSRSLSAKEKKMLETWTSYGYGEDVIRKAYDVTVDATGNASIPYTNAVLERWNGEGLHSLQEIEAKLAEEQNQRVQKDYFQPQNATKPARGRKQKPQAAGTFGNSFDTDDFFEAALQRSLWKEDAPASDDSEKS